MKTGTQIFNGIKVVLAAISIATLVVLVFPSESLPIGAPLPLPPMVNFVLPGQKSPQVFIDQWLLIPTWLAGKWQGKEQTIFWSYNHKTKKYLDGLPQDVPITRVSTIGTQKDSRGAVWHAAAPYTKIIDAPSYTECHEIKSAKLLFRSDDALIISSIDLVSRYSKTNNELLDEFQEQTVTSYRPLSEKQIVVTYDINDYDLDGMPLFSSRAFCTQSRISPFQQVDIDGRGNLNQMFKRFLFESALEKLIPR